MSKLWTIIIGISIIYGCLTGRSEFINKEIMEVPEKAFNLIITLVTTSCFWCGFMNVANDVGLIKKVANFLRPFLIKIFPRLDDEEAIECISTNIAANIFGLGFAATPSGLKGIKRLKELSSLPEGVATDEMITFLVLNTSGVTLIPTTVMAIRQSLGSQNPADFIFVGIIATICSTIAGLIADKMYRKEYKD